ncbi:hypothetical protein [Staphylococcus sp. 11261D007BR]
MYNIFSSDCYRISQKKSLWILAFISIVLVFLAACTLLYFGHKDASFRYFRFDFYVMNAISLNLVTLLITYLFGVTLLSANDYHVTQYAIDFGYHRSDIFLGKLSVSLITYLIYSGLIFIEMMLLGALLFPDFQDKWLVTLKAVTNMVPIFLSVLCVAFSLAIIRVSYIVTIFVIAFIYLLSEKMMYQLGKYNQIFEMLHQFTPGELYLHNLDGYYSQNLSFEASYWLVGICISIIFLTFSYFIYRRKEI